MIGLKSGVLLVEVERSGVVESVHTGHVIVLAPDGSVRFAAGYPDQPIFGRSTLKPLQAVGLLQTGLRLDLVDLALAASSHSGSPQHLKLIAAELAEAGLSEADLDCPPDLPFGEPERRAYLVGGNTETRLAMNCSGKHAAMLRACQAAGWPLSGYLAPSHPLQLSLHDSVSQLCEEPVAATGIDGCGAPLFGLSLHGIARAFARIAAADSGPEHQVAEAMRAHPSLVAGDGRVTTRLMQGVGGLIAKDGAEGVFAAALPDGGAVALKIDDGAARAADQAIVGALRHLGIDAAVLDDLAAAPLLGGGRPVGEVRAAF